MSGRFFVAFADPQPRNCSHGAGYCPHPAAPGEAFCTKHLKATKVNTRRRLAVEMAKPSPNPTGLRKAGNGCKQCEEMAHRRPREGCICGGEFREEPMSDNRREHMTARKAAV